MVYEQVAHALLLHCIDPEDQDINQQGVISQNICSSNSSAENLIPQPAICPYPESYELRSCTTMLFLLKSF
jgi:hypothetical protein